MRTHHWYSLDSKMQVHKGEIDAGEELSDLSGCKKQTEIENLKRIVYIFFKARLAQQTTRRSFTSLL